MCPAPVYSYFDAQLLADFIMNSQIPGYDGTNTTATSADPTYGHFGSIPTAFSGAADDYESHDNARARKRRMTVSDDRRGTNVHGFSLSESMNDSLFSSVLDQSHVYGTAGYQQIQGTGAGISGAAMPMLPIQAGPDDTPLNAALTNSMVLSGMDFSQSAFVSAGVGSGSGSGSESSSSQLHASLASPHHAGRANGRKHQSLSIAISNSLRNDIGSQEPPTPSMFSPSFANAMESAAAANTMEGAAAAAAAAAVAGMSSPSIFYNATSPYTPGHAHHHSFSMPGTTQQRQGAGIFNASNAVGPSGAAIPHSIGAAASFRTNTSASSGGIGADDDYSVGLQITMNAAMAAAMGGSFDESSHNRNASTASAFSRVHAPPSVSQMISNGIGADQTPAGLGLDISTTFASFANIPGLDAFPSAPLDRQHSFSQGLPHGDCASASYGTLSTEPTFLGSMDPAASLHTAVSHSRFISAAGSSFVSSASPSTSAMENLVTSPVVSGSHGSVRSPAPAGTKKSRKRAATVSTIRAETHQQQQQQLQHRKTHQPAALVSMSMHGSTNGSALSCLSSESSACSGPVFNSQAIVKGSGSKVVMVLTSKVAQKSYGTEKRFLCPPPTILLFGDNWKLPLMGDQQQQQQQTSHGSDFAAAMPRISVSVPTNDGPGMLGDMSDSASGSSSESRVCQLEWLTQPDPSPKPKAHVPHNPVPPARAPQEGDTVTGRYVAKQLFINDVDEKRKKVAVKVRLHDPSGQVVINEFESRPIKVISKPSKKRQSVKNVDLCIHHGSTISLFNRLRSQTVSTKYLGATRSMSVGGPRPFWFPARDNGDSASNGVGAAGGPSNTTTFVARNSVWDPFIIWIVNTHLGQKEIDAFNERIAANPTPIPGYPTPPTFAMHPQCPPDFDSCTSNGGCSSPGESGDQVQIDGESMGQPQPRTPIPILYNQPVILQCVSTGMCSPVLTLRKVEKGSMAVGSFYGRDSSRDVLGDPVSQLHKVAFEVRVQTREELPAVTVTPAGLNTRVGSYLTCMGDIVGLNATCDGRQLATDSQSGGKPRGSPGQGRKQAKDGASVGTTSWTEDVGDNAVWTMVGTDCTIYRFDYPPTADIVSQLQQATASSNALPVTPSATEPSSMTSSHTSLALPPTPTSPSGIKDYGQSGSQTQFSLEMMLAEHSSAAVAAAVGGISSADFQHGAIDPSLAAAVYGITMPM
ncbi:hypothetical protein LPJ75_001167, partial [Coemansia sp. RSA 2598]